MAARFPFELAACAATVDEFLSMLARTSAPTELAEVMTGVCRELGFRHYALIHHVDLRGSPAGYVRLMDYPVAIVERIIEQATWRRDPIIRASLFAGRAFLWSELPSILRLDRRDHQCLDEGLHEGLNEGITIPYAIMGKAMGSCTFAGTRTDGMAERRLGMAQIVGIFAFQAGQRVFGCASPKPAPRPRLHPRPRDCIVLVGRGLSNKEIARSLGLAPRTVDSYLTEARRLFDAHDRTELLVSALLAGEVGLDELACRQPG